MSISSTSWPPRPAWGAVRLDGSPIDADLFEQIGDSDFWGAQVQVALGSHTLDDVAPFGVTVYGFDSDDSYGYPGGFGQAAVATVRRVSAAPAAQTDIIGTQACVDATVTDGSNAPVTGVRVDVTVVGRHPQETFGFTDADGALRFCVTGLLVGEDSIHFRVGDTEASATIEWRNEQPVNHAPVAEAKSVSTPEDTPVAVTLSGTDPDRDSLTFAVVTGPSHGSLSGSGASRTYTPDAGFSGPDSFTYRAQ